METSPGIAIIKEPLFPPLRNINGAYANTTYLNTTNECWFERKIQMEDDYCIIQLIASSFCRAIRGRNNIKSLEWQKGWNENLFF